jgi:hypothetical protein
MHQGLKDLLASERGALCVLLVLASLVLVVLGRLTVDAWLAYTKWIATVLVASKTVTGALETWVAAPEPMP